MKLSLSGKVRTAVRIAAVAVMSLAGTVSLAQAQGHRSGGGHGSGHGGAGAPRLATPGTWGQPGTYSPGRAAPHRGVHGPRPDYRGSRGGGRYRHGGPRPGWGWGGVGVGVGLGLGFGLPYYYDYPGYPSYPGYMAVEPNVVYTSPQPVPLVAAQSSQPVIYPRNGQDAAQTDADSDQCSAWAGQQPHAVSDRAVFWRAVQACMDARGYTVR